MSFKTISPNHELIEYMGRIDFSNPCEANFFYAGSSLTLSFIGTSFSLKLCNHRFYGKNSCWLHFRRQELASILLKMTRI